jgi:hypothetical protein
MPQHKITPLRAVVEVAFIIFLFYANLLMGEFTAHSGAGKTLAGALEDVITYKNFGIGVVSAIVGFVGFEKLRRQV